MQAMSKKLKIPGGTLATDIDEIRVILESLRSMVTLSEDDIKRSPGRIQLLKRQIYAEFSELTQLLEMIRKIIFLLRIRNQKLEALRDELPKQMVDKIASSERLVARLMNQLPELTANLKILIKALYEWLYHLKELLVASVEIQSLISHHHWLRLQSFCDIRNKLITHKGKTKYFFMGALRFSEDFSKCHVFLTPFSPPDSAIKELDTLFPECAGVLSKEERSEENYFERINLLYKNLHKLEGRRREKVVSFVSRFGTYSDSPEDISSFLLDFVREFMPKLNKLKD